MAYYWKCKKHNEVMKERLDDTGTKIIPYCSQCLAEKEYEEVLADPSKRVKYKPSLPLFKKINFKIGTQFYIILFSVLLLAGLLGALADNEISTAIFCSFLILLLIEMSIYSMFFSKSAKQKVLERSLPTLEQILEMNSGIINSNQSEVDEYKKRLKRQYMYRIINFDEIDNMDGFEFEQYTARLLENLGFKKAYVTPKSGDFGADVIAMDSNDIRVAVQCKRYGKQNLVGNDAIQQIHSAKDFYDCQKSLVVTTSYFSKPAFKMAQKIGVELWNRKTLKEKIASVSKESWNDYLSKYYIKPKNKIPLTNDRVDYVKNESL